MLLEPIELALVDSAMAERVAIPAYDSLTARERAEWASNEPMSFLHAIGIGPDPISTAVEGLARLAPLFDEPQLRALVYRLAQGETAQTGLVCGIAFAQLDLVKPHESISPSRVESLVTYYEKVGVVSSPVAVAYRRTAEMDALMAHAMAAEPVIDFVGHDGLHQTVWEVDGSAVADAGRSVDSVYITDGHHRVASLREYAVRHAVSPPLLAVLFADDDLSVSAFNRIVLRVDERKARALLVSLGAVQASQDQPEPGQCICLFNGDCLVFDLPPATVDSPSSRLDSARLDEHVIGPLDGIATPGGNVVAVPGLVDIDLKQVTAADGIAFILADPTIEQLMEVADAGENMPAKSTYFSPKPRSGLFLRRFN